MTSRSGNSDNDNRYSSSSTDYRATQTASTNTSATDNTTAPTISYSSRTATTITLSRTNLTGSYIPAATTITVGGTTYYKGNDGTYSATAPSVTLNPSYSWSVTSGNASITQAGVVTPNNNITNNITVRLTTTNTNPALTKTTDYTINVSSTAAATTYSGGLNAVTPANNSITYNTNTGITLDSPARKKNTTAAYQTYTASGNTFYRVNNNFQAAAPTATSTDVAVTSYSWTLSGAGASNAQLASATGTTNTLTYNTASPSDVATTITVTANYAEGGNVSKNANVTLRAYVADPTAIAADDIKLRVGETLTLNPTLSCAIPSYTNIYRSLSYSSANTGIATVNATSGLVTAVAQGNTTITITAALQGGGTITKTINVTVAELAAAPTITFDNTTGELTMSSTTPGAEIHYTLNGSEPTESSATYNAGSKPVLTQGATVKAITTASGYIVSNTTSLTVEQVATPSVTVDGTTVNLACATAGVTYYYTTDGSEPTLSSTSTTSTSINNFPSGSTIKVIAVKNGMVTSEVASKYIELSLATPTITIAGGQVTMMGPEGATIHYTTDGSEPTASSPTYTTPLTATNGVTYKAIAVKAGFANSEIAEERYMISNGISSNIVTLNDVMDHSWTLFKPTINGETNPIYYANPKDVKITYKANGGAVSISESADQFVYYKTLTDDYKYTTIPNPFSKRPRDNGNYQGFSKWKITRISGGTITGLGLNSEVNAETELTFIPTNEYGMEVDFEVVWTRAYVVECSVGQVNANLNNDDLAGDSYETNFIVITSGDNSTTNLTATTSKKVTITMVTPDGATDYRTNTRYITPQAITLSNDWKFEYININNNTWTQNRTQYTTTITANNHNLVLGRGISNTSATGVVAGTVQGISGGTNNLNYHIRMESGRYTNVDATRNGDCSCGGTQTIKMTLGCDYDRANVNASGENDNTKLYVTSRLYGGSNVKFTDASNKSRETLKYWMKSGTFLTSTDMGSASNGQFYFGISGYVRYTGKRTLIMEGGNIHSISGGLDYHGADNTTSYGNITTSQYVDTTAVIVELHIRGGHVRGSIYGSAQYAAAKGKRKFVLTGGEINGWVAGGCDGTNTDGGQTYGSTYIYVGGETEIKPTAADPTIDYSKGGNVFGAGSGNSGATGSTATVGRVNNSTLVVADKSYVQRNIYGGGNYGYVMSEAGNTDKTGSTRIYITGGHVAGNVFGGSNNQQGQKIKIVMTGGQIDQGLYGGSNTTGTINNYVTMQINGGQVGIDATHTGNIHGGGYGQPTRVNGNVDLTLGNSGAARNAAGVTVWGDVYGGSALGSVNGETATNTYHTNVTMNAGYIHGSLYGGALGSNTVAANVYGPVQVKVYGGSVFNTDGTGANGSGAVYGANNINGAPQRSVTVDIYGTNSAPAEGEYALFSVYGGGNAADYTYGNGYPKVTVHNCDNSIEYVYGGGNAAAVQSTDVTIYGGNKIGNVFGGGNGQVTAANVTGGTNVKIYGGTIGDVYGGSNTNGSIGGTINVNVNAQAEPDHSACPIDIDNVYGGGNKADSKAGNVTIGCAEHIGAVYGGANQANINDNINLSIVSGHIDNVFGGNNNSGTISGNITVNVNDNGSACGMLVGNVYGGGNKAAYGTGTNYPVVNIQNGHLTGSVFGGGLGETAVVTGNPQVTIGQPSTGTVHIDGNVFGGGDAANVVGKPVVVVQNCSTMIGTKTDGVWNATGGTVYGGGNAAHVTGAGNGTSVTINGGDINRVFGGGNGEVSPANVEGNAVTTIHAGNIHQAFAGSNMRGNISGSATITVNKVGTCGEYIDEVYGGGNKAAGNAGTVNIDCGAIVGDVYGGANQADINSDITLNITGGTINRVFGGNNTSGNISGAITVNINKADACNDFSLNYVYGAGNQASYTPSTPGAYPAVNILKGTVTHDVFGGGLGATAIVTSNPTVTINGGTVSGNVFGGGSAADVVGNTSIHMTEGTVSNIYGGGEAADVVVGAAETGKTVVNMNGGTVSHSVYGGGLGNTTNVATSTTVTANGGTVTEDVYGGSGFGKVGATTVTIKNGATVTRDVFGGGFGQNADAGAGKEAYEADVIGNASVTINKGAVINGNVYGGNNTNGSPKGTITVLVDGPVDAGEKAATPLNLKDVFGGGKNAATTSTGAPQVTIQGCETVIARVFGGGDAAPAPATDVTIWGGHITSAFAGGNGEVTAADIVGNVNITIKGGAITNVYGGSNTAGSIGGEVNVVVDKVPEACDLDVTNLFGGGNLAPGKGGTLTIACTGDGKIDNVYGGANQADVEGDVTLVINGGNIGNAFGGNNQSGAINGAITVVVEWDGDCDENNLDYVYGGGNLAPYTTPDGKVGPTVQLINATINNNVYGGGLGAAARITGNPVVTLEGATVTGNIFGGGDAAPVEGNPTVTATEGAAAKIFAGGKGATAVVTGNPTAILNKADDKTLTVTEIYGGGDAAEVTGNTTVTLTKGAVTNAFGGGNAAAINGNTTVSIADATASNVYGGGNLAGVTQTATINMTGGNVTTGLYGGCNSEGTVTGDIAVNVTGGQVGTDAEHKANVHGGGYGSATQTAGTVAVAVNGAGVVVFGDIYGGSALGNVNDNTDDNTTVTITAGTVNGDVYGGGLGDASNAALVNGNVAVNINGGTVTGNVFGCNNVNGTPKGSVAVTVAADANANIAEVYGGGNQATYNPTTAQAPVVTINGCGNTIGYVYGGGNAADVPATNVTIWGGTIGNVFGGGHGDKDANPATEANVTGNVTVNIKGGTITNVFAGSNSKGNIGGTVDLTINKDGVCPMHITDVYGGGNQAAGNAGQVAIGCTGGADEGIQNVYGGANAADINSNIALVITGGTINNVFGGNNSSGNISGTIDVTIDWNGSCTTNHINNVYGAGNQAAYTGSPAVKIYNGEVSQNVFGGGLGATAVVTGDPVVTIGDATAPAKVATVGGDVYGGGDAAAVVGSTQVNVIAKDNTTIQNVYGGGNAADVNGTDVNIDGGHITGMVFGGGHGNAGSGIAADVNGNVAVDVTGGTINKVFGGSNDKGNITGTVAVNINKGNDSNPMHITEVYGGGNVAAGNAGTVTIGCTGGADEGIGTVYGGANNADVGNDIVLNISGGRINNVFGGNNNGGSISGTISVIVDWDGRTCDHNYLENVYGAGNLAQYSAPAGNVDYPQVFIRNATIEQNVYGAGKGDATRPSDNLGQVTGNPQVFVGTASCETDDHNNSTHTVTVKGSIYGGGNAAPVTGNPYVETNGKTNLGVVISNYVFGGGLGATAKITGSTKVKILGDTNVGKNVYGGGHGGDVTGNTHVVIGE